jgi:signal transduction histidine kinase
MAEEAGRLLRADLGIVCRYEPDQSVTAVAAWSGTDIDIPVGTRDVLPEAGVIAMVLRSGTSARVDDYEGISGPVRQMVCELGIRSAVGAPVVVEGRVWGAMVVASNNPAPLPPDSELRLAGFTELVATAISNAANRAQLAASRARIVATADETRRQIERDLHDGIQQRLVTLALKLQAVRDGVPPERQDLLAQLSHVDGEVGAMLDDVREISRGVHPAILSEGGLGPAIRALARRGPLRVVLDLGAVQRLPEPVEVAAYYVVSEALANATKHANASVAHVSLDVRDGKVHVAIRDDGIGGADPAKGTGLLGLTDRAEALGGTIAMTSPPGEGTSIVVGLPLSPTTVGAPRRGHRVGAII